MKLHRDWEAVFYENHGYWGVTATDADCEPRPDNGADRYCVFDSLEDDDEATHRLIAAAPDLLDALRLLYEETADYIRVNNLGDVHHNLSMQKARAALAKADMRTVEVTA